MYSLKEGSSTVNKVTDTGTAFTNGFTFELTGTNVTYHKCDLAFMGLFYPDVLPTDDEARAIIAYHYDNHTTKEKVLHSWFNNRARYVSLIPDGSIIDPSDSASIVDPSDGTTYIIEA